MTNLVPDYQPPDNSYQVGGGDWRYGQSMVDQALDTVLTGFAAPLSSSTRPKPQDGLVALKALLEAVPLSVLQMFRPFTFNTPDSDWDDQYQATQDILRSFVPKNRETWIAEFERLTGLNIDEGAHKFFESLQAKLRDERLDWITDFETRTGLNIDEGSAKFLQSLYLKLGWTDLANRLQAAVDRQAEAQRDWQRFVQQFYLVFAPSKALPPRDKPGKDDGSDPPKRVTSKDALDALEVWADSKFGPDAPISKAVDNLQKFFDGIEQIFKPGATDTPVADAIKAILGINDKATIAQETADRANMGIAAIRAEQSGGKSDEFLYSLANTLPSPDWQMYRHGPTAGTNASLTWGPDGNGAVVYKPNGIAGFGQADIIYRWNAYRVPGAKGQVMIQFSKPPSTMAYLGGFAVGSAFICWNMNATDQACDRFEITQDKVQLQSVDSAGNATNVGSPKTIPKVQAGDQFTVLFDDTTNRVQLLRTPVGSSGGAVTDVDTTYSPHTGDCVGFGAHAPAFTGTATINNPCPAFAGITAHT